MADIGQLPKEKTIGGHTYAVHMLPAMEGWRLFVELASAVGPSIGVVLDALPDTGSLKDFALNAQKIATEEGIGAMDLKGDKIEAAIRSVLKVVDPDFVERVTKQLARQTTVDGKALTDVFEFHFAGKIGGLVKWLAFALSVQYADFFDG